LDLKIGSVASLFVSRWDVAVAKTLPAPMHNRLGIAMARRTFAAYRQLLASERWRKLAALGANPQRMLWASTGTKDPTAPDTLYVSALADPDTIDTMPEKTLLAFADHGHAPQGAAAASVDHEAVIQEFKRAGIDDTALAAQLQLEGVQSFAKSWASLLGRVRDKGAQAAVARRA
jgi:transaldolase